MGEAVPPPPANLSPADALASAQSGLYDTTLPSPRPGIDTPLNALPPQTRGALLEPTFSALAASVLSSLLSEVCRDFVTGASGWEVEGVDVGGVTDTKRAESSIFGGGAANLNASRGGFKPHRSREGFPGVPPPAGPCFNDMGGEGGGGGGLGPLYEVNGEEELLDLEDGELEALRARGKDMGDARVQPAYGLAE